MKFFALLTACALLMVALLGCAGQPADNQQSSQSPSETDSQSQEDPKKEIPGGQYYRFKAGEVVDVQCGGEAVFALKADGTLWAWGENEFNILGIAEGEAYFTPQKLPIEGAIKSFAVGEYNALAVTQDNSLYMWGDNRFGSYGNGTANHAKTPVKVPFPHEIQMAKTTSFHSAVLSTEGELYVSGYNLVAGGQQSNPDDLENAKLEEIATLEFIKLDFPEKIVDFALWHMGRIFVAESGGVYALGSCGDQFYEELTKIDFPEPIRKARLAGGAMIALGQSGTLYGQGSNYAGVLGSTEVSPVPPTHKICDFPVADFEAGYITNVILDTNGKLYALGTNDYGTVSEKYIDWSKCVGDTLTTLQPIAIQEKVVKLHVGMVNAACITEDGHVYIWGGNYWGEKLNGTRISQGGPEKITE